MIGSEPRSWSS